MHRVLSYMLIIRHVYLSGFISAVLIAVSFADGAAQCADCDECMPRIALKTNLLHDAMAIPDIGVEVSIGRQWSLSAEGVWAWWSRESAHRCWRIYGGWTEFRFWFGEKVRRRALTGHHVGVYGSMLTYDFEFGNKGWQSPDFTYGIGIGYGYSWCISRYLNIDVGARVGYSVGRLIKYHPQCDTYVCQSHPERRYIGLTGLEVTLVWFPGNKHKNNPVRNL